MSLIDLDDAKDFLNVIHDADDEKIQALLDGAEDEALQFLDRDYFGDEVYPSELVSEPASEDIGMPDTVRTAVLLLLQAVYTATPQEAEMLRHAAEVKLMPYRRNLGV